VYARYGKAKRKINLKDNHKKYLKVAIKIIISLATLYFVFTKIQWNDVLDIYSKSNIGYLFIALVIFVISKTIAAFRLNLFLKSLNINISTKFNFKLYLLGMFYNLFLPGGIGGDGYKIYLLNKKFDTKLKKIFWALFIDRISGVIALAIILLALAYFIDVSIIYQQYVGILAPIILASFYFVIKLFFNYFIPIFTRINILSLLVQLSQVVAVFFILKGIGCFDNTVEYLFIFLFSSIIAMLPISIGGIGAREITFLYGAQYLALDVNSSIALSLMFYFITAIVSLSGLYYSLRPGELRSTTSEKQI